MTEQTFSLIEYYPAPGTKVCPFCEVENSSANSCCYICNTNLSIPYIEPFVKKEKAPGENKDKDVKKPSPWDPGTGKGASGIEAPGFGKLSVPDADTSAPSRGKFPGWVWLLVGVTVAAVVGLAYAYTSGMIG